MIIYIILQMIYGLIFIVFSPTLLFNFIPNFSVSSGLLPFGMDEAFVLAVGMFKAFMVYFPPIQVIYDAIIIYMWFEIALFILKLILGSRAPQTSIR